MSVKRIVANVKTTNLNLAKIFYQDILGLEQLMDQGWMCTYGNTQKMNVQLSFFTQGGSGTDVPELSIEVDDVDDTLRKMEEGGFPIMYGPVNETWGVRRFYVKDPFGKLINILAHR